MGTILGEKIKTLRTKKGLTLEKLAEITNTSKSYIWELENGNSSNPTAYKISKISQALDVTTDYLTNDEAELSKNVLEKAFFRKFKQLSLADQKKVEQIIDLLGKEKKLCLLLEI